MKKLNTIEDLIKICQERSDQLSDISSYYLSDRGLGALEAYRAILWHASFHDNLISLINDENFNELESIEGKDPEYYMLLRICKRAIKDSI